MLKNESENMFLLKYSTCMSGHELIDCPSCSCNSGKNVILVIMNYTYLTELQRQKQFFLSGRCLVQHTRQHHATVYQWELEVQGHSVW